MAKDMLCTVGIGQRLININQPQASLCNLSARAGQMRQSFNDVDVEMEQTGLEKLDGEEGKLQVTLSAGAATV